MVVTPGQFLKCRHENSTKEKNMTTQFTNKGLFIVLAGVCCGAILAPTFAQTPAQTKARIQYQVSNLPGLGGTSNGGNSINDQTWVSGYATGADNLGQVVGWAENGFHDPNCCCTQVLQFRPAVWTLGPLDQTQDLPLIPGDSSGAATAINDSGQIVGISGICDQAVGRHTAKHAVLWENGTVMDIYPNAPAPWWNTPTAINQRGDVVGFAGDPAFVE